MKRFSLVFVLLLFVLGLALPVAAQDQTIVDIAAGNEDFSTLVAAVTAADLVETLSSEGPFTVFAPTNDAFTAALDELGVTLDDLVADTEMLTGILTYHVVAGEVLSGDLVDGMRVETVNGATLVVNIGDDGVTLTDSAGRTATVTAADIDASNGVIHMIDTVILPPSGTVVDIAVGNEDFSTLVAAVDAAGLVETLSGEGPFTVFAPTNDAFTAALDELGVTLDDLVADTEMLTSILTYHVVAGKVFSGDLTDGMEVETVNGATFTVNIGDDGVTLTDGAGRSVNVVATDIEGTNGVIHVIDKVIVPPADMGEDMGDEDMGDEDMSDEDMTDEDMDDEMMGDTIADIVIAGSEGGVNDREGFSLLLAAIQNADPSVLEALSGEGSFTVFAPNNQAFYNLAAALNLRPSQLLSAENQTILTQVLLYHVIDGEVYAEDVMALSDGAVVPTLLQDEQNAIIIYFGDSGNPYLNNGIDLVATDIQASNGVIHVINDVLVPECVAEALAEEGACGD